ncbi:MAG: PDZ domain-containing protein [Gemmatimonadota bacterium]|nr:PDZ domain-containing protein [Gemmatimonadota bacterium]
MRRGVMERIGVTGAFALALSVGAFAPVSAQETDARDRFAIVGGAGGSYLGVTIEDVDGELARELGLGGEYGAHVTGVAEGGPAEEAGLREGDVIVRWNGDRLESVAQLQRRMGETPAGRTVSLGIRRDGADREIAVELGDRREQLGDLRVFTVPRSRVGIGREQADAIRERASELRQRMQENLARPDVRRFGRDGVVVFGGRPRLGVSIQSLGDQLAEYFGVDGGALVTAVTEDSPAEAAGIRAGDVIVAIDGTNVEDSGALLEALSELDAGPVDVTVVREGAQRTFTVELEERGEGWGTGSFYFRDGDGESGIRMFGRDGVIWSIDPISLEEIEIGPIEWSGFDVDGLEWSYDLDDYESLEIRIPRIVVPGFEMPGIRIDPIEIPRIDALTPPVDVVM